MKKAEFIRRYGEAAYEKSKEQCRARFAANKKKCIDCGKEISITAMRCKSCANKGKRNPAFGKSIWLGKHHSEKTKEKMRILATGRKSYMRGKKFSQKARDNMSAAHIGNTPWNKGVAHNPETRAKISASHKGMHSSPQTKKKISDALKGKVFSQSHKDGISTSIRGEKNPCWKGGCEIANARREEKRRGFGFIPLNDQFIGSEGHHIDKEFVVYIPKEMHRSIHHSVINDVNMEEINALALDFVYGD